MYKKAFTLIEILVVVAIVGVLASVVLVNLTKGREKATNTAISEGARQWVSALNLFYADNGYYPGSGGGGYSTCLGKEECDSQGGTQPDPAFIALMDPYLRGTPNPNQDFMNKEPTGFNKIRAWYAGPAFHGTFNLEWFLYGNSSVCAGGGSPTFNEGTGITQCDLFLP